MLYNPWGGAGLRPPLSAMRHRRYKERNFRHDSGSSAVSTSLAVRPSELRLKRCARSIGHFPDAISKHQEETAGSDLNI